MAIENEILQNFFTKQKKASIDSLLTKSEQEKSSNLDDGRLNKKPTGEILTPQFGADNINPPLADREHTVSKALADREHTVSRPLADREHTVSIPLAVPLADREHTVSNLHLNIGVDKAVGKEKKLLLFVFKKCQSAGSLETEQITTEELTEYLQIEASHLRNLIHRISKKALLEVSASKKGKFVWRKFKLSKDVFQQLILDEGINIALADREQSVSRPLAVPLATPPSSSSYNIYKTTTDLDPSEGSKNDRHRFWESISEDLKSLQSEGVDLTHNHISQLLSIPDIKEKNIEIALNAYLYDIRKHNKLETIKTPIEWFMKIMRTAGFYGLPSGYKTKEILYHEQLERLEKQEKLLEEKTKERNFIEWYETLSSDEKSSLIENNISNENKAVLSNKLSTENVIEKTKIAVLKTYYKENIYKKRPIQMQEQVS